MALPTPAAVCLIGLIPAKEPYYICKRALQHLQKSCMWILGAANASSGVSDRSHLNQRALYYANKPGNICEQVMLFLPKRCMWILGSTCTSVFVFCSVLQCFAVCCSVLQCVAVCSLALSICCCVSLLLYVDTWRCQRQQRYV